jgi:hypothetical protein
MTFKKFADENRLKISRDPDDDTPIIRGRTGKSHVFEHGDGVLGVAVMPETGTSHRWTAARKAFEAAGMGVTQNGDCEGIATFDPENPEHVRLACMYADVLRRRERSLAQKESVAKARAMATRNLMAQTPVEKACFVSRIDHQALTGHWDHPERL